MRVVYYLNRHSWRSDRIKRVEIVKETKCYLWHGDDPKRLERLDKSAAYDSFEEAKTALVEHCEIVVEAAQKRLDAATAQLEAAKALEPIPYEVVEE